LGISGEFDRRARFNPLSLNRWERWSRIKMLEAVFLLLSLVYLERGVWRTGLYPRRTLSSGIPLHPPGDLTAYRFGERETATATLLLSAIALWGTRMVWVRCPGAPQPSLLLLQAFMGVIAVME